MMVVPTYSINRWLYYELWYEGGGHQEVALVMMVVPTYSINRWLYWWWFRPAYSISEDVVNQ